MKIIRVSTKGAMSKTPDSSEVLIMDALTTEAAQLLVDLFNSKGDNSYYYYKAVDDQYTLIAMKGG